MSCGFDVKAFGKFLCTRNKNSIHRYFTLFSQNNAYLMENTKSLNVYYAITVKLRDVFIINPYLNRNELKYLYNYSLRDYLVNSIEILMSSIDFINTLQDI